MTRRTGERGDRGVGGERGPKGDHGQQGERGPQGESAAPLSWWDRHKGLIGYLFLTAAVAYSIAAVQAQGIERREALAESARVVVIDGCSRDNGTRLALREIIQRSDNELDQYVKEGTLTKEQAERAEAANRSALRKLKNVDCQAEADKLSQADSSNKD